MMNRLSTGYPPLVRLMRGLTTGAVASGLVALLSQSPAVTLGKDVALSKKDSHLDLIDQVESSYETQFSAGIRAYDEALEDQPNDSVLATERCHFISYFAYSEDFYLEEASDLLDEGIAYLERFQNNPEVEVYRLDQLYGEELVSRGKELLKNREIPWTDEQLAYVHLRIAQQGHYDSSLAPTGIHSGKSLRLNPTTTAQLLFANHLYSEGKNDEALEVLRKSYPDETVYQKREKMNLFSELGNERRALQLLMELREEDETVISKLEVGRIFARSNRPDEARAAFKEAMESQWTKGDAMLETFELEKKYGTPQEKLAAYNSLRDLGFANDPFLHRRIELFVEHPELPWRWRDGLGGLALAGMIVGLCLLPLAWLVPIHYWGLLRQKKGIPNREFAPAAWGLRKSWLVAAFFLVSSTMISYWFVYDTIFQGLFEDEIVGEILPIPKLPLARTVVVTDVFVLLGLIFLLRKDLFRAMKTPVWSVWKCVGLSLLCYIPLRIVAGLNRLLVGTETEPTTAEISLLTESLTAVLSNYGPCMLIVVIAVLTPIIEEVVFRGVFLNAFAKHIPFGWANAIQAFLFMAVHEQYELFPFLFVFGIVTGLLRRSSSSLLPGIFVHALNNGVVALYMIAASP